MSTKKDAEWVMLREELSGLYEKLKGLQVQVTNSQLENATASLSEAPKLIMTTKKILRGHNHKINSVHYSGDNRHCVSGSLDGKLIIWDTWSGNKVKVIPLRSSWVMSVAFSTSGKFVACGGMDNMCTVYDVEQKDSSGRAKLVRELVGYEGFLSSCLFLDDKNVITGSGDKKICLWDLEMGKKTAEFEGHDGDVVCISLSPDNGRYVTGSVDKTCKLWDVRDTTQKQQFFGHDGDVNSISFHPSGQAFVTASDDKTARLFDIRSDQQLAVYQDPKKSAAFTSCGTSFSGRFLFAGADDHKVHIWDSLKTRYSGSLSGHTRKVTCLTLSGNGKSLVTSSWDQYCRVWA